MDFPREENNAFPSTFWFRVWKRMEGGKERYGQAVWNTAWEMYPIVELLYGIPRVDPFHDDIAVPEFLKQLGELLGDAVFGILPEEYWKEVRYRQRAHGQEFHWAAYTAASQMYREEVDRCLGRVHRPTVNRDSVRTFLAALADELTKP